MIKNYSVNLSSSLSGLVHFMVPHTRLLTLSILQHGIYRNRNWAILFTLFTFWSINSAQESDFYPIDFELVAKQLILSKKKISTNIPYRFLDKS